MQTLDKIFSYYDQFIARYSPATGHLISLLLLVILIWQIFLIIKHGHWIFVVALILFLPGTWPAAKDIANLVFAVFKFLFIRIVI